jgi:hypothetical protein
MVWTAFSLVFEYLPAYDEYITSGTYKDGNNKELLEYLVYKSSHDLLAVIALIMKSSKEELERSHAIIEYIVNHCQGHLSDNALVKSKERCETVAPETNLLQEAQDELMDGREQREELSNHSHMPSTPSSISIFDTHEQGPLWHPKNDKFVFVPLSLVII